MDGDGEIEITGVNSLERALITELIRGTPGYGLHLSDIEELSARLKKLEEGEQRQEGDERRGAGRGGVILPTIGRWRLVSLGH